MKYVAIMVIGSVLIPCLCGLILGLAPMYLFYLIIGGIFELISNRKKPIETPQKEQPTLIYNVWETINKIRNGSSTKEVVNES